MPIFRPFLRLVRIDTSILGFLAVFLTLYTRTGDGRLSFYRALPILFICICTFIANDLNDIEKDTINHPERPLPSKEIRPVVATVLYFLALGLGLFSVRHFVEETIGFWYYGLFLISISYSLIVDHLTVIKAPYVAVTASMPIVIAAIWFPETRLFSVAASAFLITLGREICMDIKDRPGDSQSMVSQLNSSYLSKLALGLQAGGLLILLSQIVSIWDAVILFVMILLLAWAAILWESFGHSRMSIIIMKVLYFAGLYFLL